MVSIKELERVDDNYIKNMARLHILCFPGFFLTQLGAPFLTMLYKGYKEDANSGIIVAEEEGELVGFIAYSNDYSKFYKNLIKKHVFGFAMCSVGAAVKHPSIIKRILGAFRKSESVAKQERYVELASICVSPVIKGKGVGSHLINYLKEIVDYDTYEYINLETDAENNDVVNRFYIKNGFKLSNMYITPEGRRMNEYRFRKE